MSEPTLVSVIIRTCGHTDMLKNALASVCNQHYPYVEAVIIEDGPPVSESYIKSHYSNLSFQYYCTGKNIGRTRAGNQGLLLAKGAYVNFLDEDDILLENHIEILMNALKSGQAKAAYGIAEEHQIRVKSYQPYHFRVKRKLIRYKYPFNRLLLCYMNLFPIQSVLFSRSLFLEYGGFDEGLDLLEDWDLWLRYAIHTDFVFVPEVTSIYYTPYRNKKKRIREKKLHESEQEVKKMHHKYMIQLNVGQIETDMDYILNVFNKKGILFYMKKIQNYLLYHDR